MSLLSGKEKAYSIEISAFRIQTSSERFIFWSVSWFSSNQVTKTRNACRLHFCFLHISIHWPNPQHSYVIRKAYCFPDCFHGDCRNARQRSDPSSSNRSPSALLEVTKILDCFAPSSTLEAEFTGCSENRQSTGRQSAGECSKHFNIVFTVCIKLRKRDASLVKTVYKDSSFFRTLYTKVIQLFSCSFISKCRGSLTESRLVTIALEIYVWNRIKYSQCCNIITFSNCG